MKTNKETWDEMVEKEAHRRNSMAGNLALIQRLEFKAGAQFAETNARHIPCVADLIEAAKGFVRDCGCISPYRIEAELALKALEGEK